MAISVTPRFVEHRDIETQDTITPDYRVIQRFYEQDGVWQFDIWHAITRRRITRFVTKLPALSSEIVIVNVGSGGISHGLHTGRQVHIDLVLRRLVGNRGVVGDVQSLPLKRAVVDIVICVGSVLNHTDPVCAISQLVGLLKPGGYLILEFDSSDGLHHLRTGSRHSPSVRINTFYNRRMVILQEYSLRYITELLGAAGADVRRFESFHIASAAALAFGIPPSWASIFSVGDYALGMLSSMKTAGSNVILLAQRR